MIFFMTTLFDFLLKLPKLNGDGTPKMLNWDIGGWSVEQWIGINSRQIKEAKSNKVWINTFQAIF